MGDMTGLIYQTFNDTLAWDINGNRDNTACLDIAPDTLYDLPFVSEQIA